MSKLRPETETYRGNESALPDDTALFLIRDSVAKRRALIYGRLDDEAGEHCAIGAFWAGNPGRILHASLIDEVAAVNDSIPKTATPHERWQYNLAALGIAGPYVGAYSRSFGQQHFAAEDLVNSLLMTLGSPIEGVQTVQEITGAGVESMSDDKESVDLHSLPGVLDVVDR